MIEQYHHLLIEKGAKPKQRTMAGGWEGEEREVRKKVKKNSFLSSRDSLLEKGIFLPSLHVFVHSTIHKIHC